MILDGKRPVQVLMFSILAVLIVTGLSLAIVLIPGSSGFSFSSGAHFGFPSQQQASNSLGVSVTKSQVVSRSNIQQSGYFIRKAEAVFYNSTSIVAMATEFQLNSSQSASTLSGALTNAYSGQSSANASSFRYSSVNVVVLQIATGGTQIYVVAFSSGSMFCYAQIYVYTANSNFSTKAFATAFVSSVV